MDLPVGEQNIDSKKEAYVEMMREFSATAKSCVQLSTALLVLPVTILKASTPAGQVYIPPMLWLSWFLFGVSIVSGLLYQLLAAVKISAKLGVHKKIPKWWNYPKTLFWFMVLTFLLGILLTVICLTK